MNQQSGKSRSVVPRSVPRVGRTPQKSEQLPEACAKKLTLQEQLEAVKNIETDDFNPFGDSFSSLMDLILLDDENTAEPVESHVKVSKKINFGTDSMLGELENLEGPFVPEYIKLINESMKVAEERKKTTLEALDAQLNLEFKSATKLDALVTQLTDNFLPAMEKLTKDPVRVLDIVRKLPPKYGIRCNVEDQPQLLANLSQLSQDCHELKQLDTSSIDLKGEFSSFEESLAAVDSMLNTKAIEKIRFKGLQARLDEVSKTEDIDH